MAFARDTYTAAAAQTDFTITFPYINNNPVYVVVTEDGVEASNSASGDDNYTIVSNTIVRFNTGRVGGEEIIITRSSSRSTPLVDYANASTLTENDLDTANLQAIYLVQEALDLADLALPRDVLNEWDAVTGVSPTQIHNVADPTAAQDAATKAYVDAIAAAAGNVPTPGNPGQDNYILSASGGTFAWELMVAADIPNDLLNSQHYAAASIDNEHLADAAVDTEELADDAVTLAKMAVGTDGNLISYDASGDPVAVATGSAGQILTSAGAGAPPTFQAGGQTWTQSGAIATTSGTTLSLASGLSGVNEIEIVLDGTSTDTANQAIMVQLGDSGGFETSGYSGAGISHVGGGTLRSANSAGFLLSDEASMDAAVTWTGSIVLRHMGSNIWALSGQAALSVSNHGASGEGVKTLSGTLTQVQITTSGGSAAFDAGNAYVRYR